MMHYYQTRVPRKYREWRRTVFLLLVSTCSIAVLSYLNGRVGTVDLSAIAGVVSGVSAGITSWQSESGADRKINRYTNAIVALKNHILWWESLSSVDQNSQLHINRLVMTVEDIKLNEVSAWADANRHSHLRDQTEKVAEHLRDQPAHGTVEEDPQSSMVDSQQLQRIGVGP